MNESRDAPEYHILQNTRTEEGGSAAYAIAEGEFGAEEEEIHGSGGGGRVGGKAITKSDAAIIAAAAIMRFNNCVAMCCPVLQCADLLLQSGGMRWLRLVGSLKLYISFGYKFKTAQNHRTLVFDEFLCKFA